MSEKITQTAGRDQLGNFAPLFAELNDDVLFGRVWNQPALSLKTKCVVTVVALMASGITDSSLRYHLENAKNHGVTREEIAAIITHAAMYVGWPKAWAVFNLTKDVWSLDAEITGADGSAGSNADTDALSAKERHARECLFPIGAPNDGFAQYFIGQSYLAPVSTSQVPMYNVTFEPGCRNNWHIHHASSGGGQILICVAGRGFHQAWGQPVEEMLPGDVINVPAGTKHWHGAAPDSWFSHLAVEVPGTDTSNEWLEPVSDAEYARLTRHN
ncbi:carboxymuconolactone decarboxylase family protein [Actinotignum sp. GS-2025f]|uniref:carboxymuconolactone decarboxylase family protein n=1 Tax=Actinotignum TaxID=1653174 RepID=UPI002A83AB9F|nr:carboxymuconolactone decarboxylase family protein [Actinotignum sp. SLA_B059]MDY5128267.1 carboxymuconolactone decarboxylase family protein [Actinotignum sp. SLA_B059]